jgi:P-type E1-E2 ATPase
MFELDIPAFSNLRIEHLVLDFNGTIAGDGVILPGIVEKLHQLGAVLKIHVITSDTLGTVRQQIGDFCKIEILTSANHRDEKLRYVQRLGSSTVVAIGNGRNDADMLRESALGIAVTGKEGGAVDAVIAADVLCYRIIDALDLLLTPKRLLATLRG